MKNSSDSESIEAIRGFLHDEILRAQTELTAEQWQAILVGVSDDGEIGAYPCRFLLPFHYPATIDELDKRGPDHFNFPETSWSLRWQSVQAFKQQYEQFEAVNEDAESVRMTELHLQQRIKMLQDGCAGLYPDLPIFGIESESSEWWKVLTFHISGPRIPQPPPPISDVQILARLRRQTHNYVGRSAFGIRGGFISEIALDGADTTDATIDLMRGIPNLGSLLKNLRKISLQSTLVTDQSLDFLRRELPHVEIDYSHFLNS